MNRLRITGTQRLYHLPHGTTGIHDILNDNDSATGDILVQPDYLLNLSRRNRSLIRSQLHERDIRWYRYLAIQVCSEDKRTVEYTEKQRILPCEILINLLCHSLYSTLYLCLWDGYLEAFVLDFNNTHNTKCRNFLQNY